VKRTIPRIRLGSKLDRCGRSKDSAITAMTRFVPALVTLLGLTSCTLPTNQVAGFEGGRSYTGMEFGHAFASKDDIRIMAATRAVSQIEEFMRNGGSFGPLHCRATSLA
jgi:hypothetical protein